MDYASKAPSAFTKMRQAYWEAKQSFNKAIGQREDSHIVSSDSELDIKLDLLQAADGSFNELMKVTLDYRDALQDLVRIQESFGLVLIEFGTKDCTAAGKVMCMSGKAISKSAQRLSQLKTYLMNLFYEVQTFQFKATSDALQTVAQMEKVRRSYRSGLMWLKDESADLDPDVGRKLRNFKKVQQHIKRLKIKFDEVKLESMQKIDLFLLSRSNLFSHTLVPYCQSFKKICKNSSLFMDHALQNIPLGLYYNFVALKELNQYSKVLQETFQKQLSSDQESKKQNKSKTQPLKIALNSKNSSNEDLLSRNSSDVKLGETGVPPSLQANLMAGDTVLIDLNDDKKEKQSSERASSRNIDSASSEYSKDLLLVNFDDCRPSYMNELSMINFHNQIKRTLNDCIPQGSANRDSSSDLHFWSLMQSHEQASKLLEMDNPSLKTSDIIRPKQTSITSSESKWSQILVQFDPFLEEMPNLKTNAQCLELC